MHDIKLGHEAGSQNDSSLGLTVEAVGVAQIFVHGGSGGGSGAWQKEKKLLLFFTFYDFLSVKNMIWAKKFFF
jgi:hypothetical protein